MRSVFTHGHITAERNEGINATIKGHGNIDETLQNATLVELNQIIDHISQDFARQLKIWYS